ncbi:DNA-binding protein [Rhodobacteraceae bacterium W635]|nr:DNA-binding protein [Rhodobacteraceae bacterium W635]
MDQRRAADYLGVSTKWLERDRWIGASIPYVKIGRAVRYRATDLAAFVDRNMIAGGAK